MRLFILFIFSIFISTEAVAQRPGQIFREGNSNNFIAAVTSRDFEYVRASQEQNNWCWAACIQMVLSYQGLKVSQSDIVNRAFGVLVDRPADCLTTTNAAGGWQYAGKTVRASSEYEVTAKKLIDALAFKYPVIIGLNMPGQDVGHAYVLTAVYYRYDQNHIQHPYKVVLRDPWPGNPSKVEIPWYNFVSRLNCVVNVTY